MTKQVEKTDFIKAQIARAYGGEVDTDQFAVFEAVALNTLPLRRRTGVWAGAKFTSSTLGEMAAFLSRDSIPLHIMHDEENLPVGKVFFGKLEANGSDTDLHALFYVPKSETAVLNKIESGIVDEVSVGVRPKHARCSECGWDFYGNEATILHWLDATCENGHTMGVNGAHVIASGLDQWRELSLVGTGAAVRPKILSRSNAQLSEQQLQRIAASGMDPETLYFFGSATPAPKLSNKESNNMDEKALQAFVSDLTDTKANLKVAESKVAERDAKIEELTAKLAEVEAKLAAADNTGLVTEIEGLKAQLKKAGEFIADLAKKSMVALGQDNPQVPEALEAQISTITDAQAKLRSVLPIGGAARGADAGTDTEDKSKTRRLSAFKTSK